MTIGLKMLGIAAFAVGFLAVGNVAVSGSTPYADSRDPVELATTTDASYNWAGYVADSGQYTAVSATWVVPYATYTGQGELAADATWIGIGGVATRDLIQAGTQAIVDSDGTAHYQAWYETLPQASQPIAFDIAPGDEITVALNTLGNNKWQILFVDNTTGEHRAVPVLYNSSYASAEWVEEMPSVAHATRRFGGGGSLVSGFIPLDNFGSLRFERATTVKDGVATTLVGSGAKPLRMTNVAGETLAQPSVVSSAGGFSVMRTDAVASIPRPQRVSLIVW